MDVPRTVSPGGPAELAAELATEPPAASAWSRPAVMLPAFAVFAMVGALLPEFSTAATVWC